MKILLVADRSPSSFVLTDMKILQSAHSVHFLSFRWSSSNVASLLNSVRKSDLIFGWFAGHHTWLGALTGHVLRKGVVIAASDYDLANEPSFEYGSMRGGLRALINNQIFSFADAVVVPSQFSYDLAIANTQLSSRPEKLRIIPHGFEDPGATAMCKERSVTTVGAVNAENWIRKGHKQFVEAALRMRNVTAYLAGPLADAYVVAQIKNTGAFNIRVTGFLARRDLDALLARTKVYAQLSCIEGFGCSLAEAMLARCVPVVTRNGALPEVVDDCGFYVDYGNVAQACDAIRFSLEDQTTGDRARQRVLDCFPYERRRRELLELVSDATKLDRW
jgi:glycosyltransferase involved in cell wall biosynthesis